MPPSFWNDGNTNYFGAFADLDPSSGFYLRNVQVTPNPPPAVHFNNPSSATDVLTDESMTLLTTATDPLDNIECVSFYLDYGQTSQQLICDDAAYNATTHNYMAEFAFVGITAGAHTLSVIAEDERGAVGSDSVSVMVHVQTPVGTGTGLTGHYFNGESFEQRALIRVDETINFDWWEATPDPEIDPEHFFSTMVGMGRAARVRVIYLLYAFGRWRSPLG